MNKIERGERAARILNDEIFKDAFESVRQALLTKFESAPVADTEGMTKIRLCLKLLNDVRANIEATMNDGKVAAFELEEQKRVAKLSDYYSNLRFRR